MAGETILIVDDDGIVATNLQQTLTHLGYSVCAFAATAEDAIQKAKNYRPDLVLMDIYLRGAEDGIKAAAKIKKLYDIPVVYITAFSDQQLIERAKITEPFGYILKPVEPSILEVTIAMALYKHQTEKEKIKLQGQLNQAQKMQAVGNLAGGIAHEFNNIMGIIMGFTEMALLNLENPVKQKPQLEHILRASHRARDLVKQILAFSRPEEFKLQLFELGPVVEGALKMLRSLFPTTVNIRSSILSKGMVQADVTQIQQVLINLCNNASQAMHPEGGILEISLDEVQVNELFLYPDLTPGPYLRLSVSDTGSGMAPEVTERIFEPFFTTKEVGQGIGLGLSVVYGIMQGCGGTVVVNSEPGQGSTFHLFFPRIQDTFSLEPEMPISRPSRKEKILFVDDEAELVNLGQEMLESLGYQVMSLRSSQEALEVFREQPEHFDLIITDQTMPEMTGANLAAELMRLRPELPVILCTGFSEVITAAQAQEMGIKAFLMKPFGASQLDRVIRHVLEQGNSHAG